MKKIGITFSTFDLIHPGHILMLEDCKNVCDHLIVGVQSDPTIDRKSSNDEYSKISGKPKKSFKNFETTKSGWIEESDN